MWRSLHIACAACDSAGERADTFVSGPRRKLVRGILVNLMNFRFPHLNLEAEPGVPYADTPPESIRQSQPSQPSQQFQSCNSRGASSHPSTADFRSRASSESQVSAPRGGADAGGSDRGSVASSTRRPAAELRSRAELRSDTSESARPSPAEASRSRQGWDGAAWWRNYAHAPASKGRGRRASSDYDQRSSSYYSEPRSGQTHGRWYASSRAGSEWSEEGAARDRERTRDSRSDCQSQSSRRW